MNRKEFDEAVRQAALPSDPVMDRILNKPETDLSVFDGFGLRDFKPVYVPMSQVVALIRWQAKQFNGEFDQAALQEIWEARNKIIIVDSAITMANIMGRAYRGNKRII